LVCAKYIIAGYRYEFSGVEGNVVRYFRGYWKL